MNAQKIYEDFDNLTDAQVHFIARKWAVAVKPQTLENVEYVHYLFSDNSKLVVGNNGYIGAEWK